MVEPLFNQLHPVAGAASCARGILALAEQEKVPVSDVLVADASRRTTTLNAYVSGFGSTRRVVLYDNLVDDVPERETLVVVAHELGHARNHDVLLGTMLGATGVVFGSGLLGLLLLTRDGCWTGPGRRTPGSPRWWPLLLALMAVGTLLASPVQNTISRAVEARADRASLAGDGGLRGFERMQVQLAPRSLSDDDPPVAEPVLVRVASDGAAAHRDGAGARAAAGSDEPATGPQACRRADSASAGGGRAALAGDRAAGLGEGVLDDAAEQEDDGDDERGDAGDEQAVLDGGGAVLVRLAADGCAGRSSMVVFPSGTLSDGLGRVSARPCLYGGAGRDPCRWLTTPR